jgi:hypothetical protein
MCQEIVGPLRLLPRHDACDMKMAHAVGQVPYIAVDKGDRWLGVKQVHIHIHSRMNVHEIYKYSCICTYTFRTT